jgi:hypothetical protein
VQPAAHVVDHGAQVFRRQVVGQVDADDGAHDVLGVVHGAGLYAFAWSIAACSDFT